MLKRIALVLGVVVALIPTPAWAQEGGADSSNTGSDMLLMSFHEALQVIEAGEPIRPIAEGGELDPSVDPLAIMLSWAGTFDAPGTSVSCPVFTDEVTWDDGNIIDLAEFCASTDAFYEISPHTVLALAELNWDPQQFPGFAEVAIGYTLEGSPVNPEVPGFNNPTAGFSHVSALSNDGSGTIRALHSQATGDLVANEFTAAHHAGLFTTGDGAGGERYFVYFFLEDATVPYTFIVTSSTTPGDLTTFGAQSVEVDPADVPLTPLPGVETIEELTLALDEFTLGAPPPPTDDPPPVSESGSEEKPVSDGGSEEPEETTTSDPDGAPEPDTTGSALSAIDDDEGSSLGLILLLAGGAATAAIAGGVFLRRRGHGDAVGDSTTLAAVGVGAVASRGGIVEDIDPLLGEPRGAVPATPPDPLPGTEAEREFGAALLALDEIRESFMMFPLIDGMAHLSGRVIRAQGALAESANNYRLGFQRVSAAVAPADAVSIARTSAIETAQTADFIVSLVQLGMLSVTGAKALAKFLAKADDVAETAVVATRALSAEETAVGLVDETTDLAGSFAHTDEFAELNDSLAPGTWDPAVADDVEYYLSLTESELEWVNIKVAQHKWGTKIDPDAMAALAQRADVDLDAFRASRLRGRQEMPDYELVESLMNAVHDAEGWFVPTMAERFSLQQLAARTTVVAEHGQKITLRPDEITVLRRIATDPEFAANLGRIGLRVVMRRGRDLEPMLLGPEVQRLRSLADGLYGSSDLPTQFSLLHGADASQIVVSASSMPLVPVQVGELGSALTAARAGERTVVIRTTDSVSIPGARWLVADGSLVSDRVPFTALGEYYVAVLAEGVLASGAPATLVDQVLALELSGDDTAVLQTWTAGTITLTPQARNPLLPELLNIGGPLSLDADDLRVLSTALTQAVAAVTRDQAVDPLIVQDLRYLAGDNPGFFAGLQSTTLQAGPVVSYPFTDQAIAWLEAVIDSNGEAEALAINLGPVRVAAVQQAVDFAPDAQLGSLLTTGVTDAIDSVAGGLDRKFILLGHEFPSGLGSTTANVGVGLLTAPIETAQRVTFGIALFDDLWGALEAEQSTIQAMTGNVRDAESALRDLAALVGSGILDDLERDATELANLADQYESLLNDATFEIGDAQAVAVTATIAELRRIALPALATINAVQQLDQLGAQADALGQRLVDPVSGEARLFASIETPTLLEMARSWNVVRDTLATSAVPPLTIAPTRAPVKVRLPIDDGTKGEALMASAIEAVIPL